MPIEYENFDTSFNSLVSHARKLDDLLVISKKVPTNEKNMDFYQVWLKTLMHSYSLKQLIAGTIIDEAGIKIYDYSSAYIIARALYECILTAHYLFVDTDTDYSDFKYLLWKYGCYFDRSSFSAYTDETKVKKDEAISLKNKYLDQIMNSNYYKSVNGKEKNKIDRKTKNGDWKLESWSEMGKKIGFTSDYYTKMYNVLCSYAHTGSHSIFQLKSASNAIETNKLMFLPNSVLCFSLANIINIFYINFEKYFVDEIIEITQDDIDCYKLYLQIGKET